MTCRGHVRAATRPARRQANPPYLLPAYTLASRACKSLENAVDPNRDPNADRSGKHRTGFCPVLSAFMSVLFIRSLSVRTWIRQFSLLRRPAYFRRTAVSTRNALRTSPQASVRRNSSCSGQPRRGKRNSNALRGSSPWKRISTGWKIPSKKSQDTDYQQAVSWLFFEYSVAEFEWTSYILVCCFEQPLKLNC